MNIGKNSSLVLLSFLIIMFMTIIGCGKMGATSVISGKVTGTLVEGITINLTGQATASTTTDANGNFSFTNQENGNYTITPYFDGYEFSPASTAITVNGANVTGINFESTKSGYSISGMVTGAVAANVILSLSDGSLTTATTTAAGNYTLTALDISNGTFTVTPSLAGYKFTANVPAGTANVTVTAGTANVTVTVGTASVTGINFVSEAAHSGGSANGDYTWDAANGDLTITWTAGNTPCNWPQVTETEDESGVTISTILDIAGNTDTIMTWPDSTTWPGMPDSITWPNMVIWTRSTSSTAADPLAGVWTAYDQSGNQYTATFTASVPATTPASGTISLVENIIACAYTWSEIISGDYNVWLSYQDPQNEATSVSVTGPGISGSQSLAYNSTSKEWNTASSIDIETLTHPPSMPSAPYTYTFTITDSKTTWEETSCFVDLPTGLTPKATDTVDTKQPTFSWNAIKAGGAIYMVQVMDSNYNLQWESNETQSTSMVYGSTGSAKVLTSGTYYYYVIVTGTTSTTTCNNGRSFAEGSFTYTGP